MTPNTSETDHSRVSPVELAKAESAFAGEKKGMSDRSKKISDELHKYLAEKNIDSVIAAGARADRAPDVSAQRVIDQVIDLNNKIPPEIGGKTEIISQDQIDKNAKFAHILEEFDQSKGNLSALKPEDQESLIQAVYDKLSEKREFRILFEGQDIKSNSGVRTAVLEYLSDDNFKALLRNIVDKRAEKAVIPDATIAKFNETRQKKLDAQEAQKQKREELKEKQKDEQTLAKRETSFIQQTAAKSSPKQEMEQLESRLPEIKASSNTLELEISTLREQIKDINAQLAIPRFEEGASQLVSPNGARLPNLGEERRVSSLLDQLADLRRQELERSQKLGQNKAELDRYADLKKEWDEIQSLKTIIPKEIDKLTSEEATLTYKWERLNAETASLESRIQREVDKFIENGLVETVGAAGVQLYEERKSQVADKTNEILQKMAQESKDEAERIFLLAKSQRWQTQGTGRDKLLRQRPKWENTPKAYEDAQFLFGKDGGPDKFLRHLLSQGGMNEEDITSRMADEQFVSQWQPVVLKEYLSVLTYKGMQLTPYQERIFTHSKWGQALLNEGIQNNPDMAKKATEALKKESVPVVGGNYAEALTRCKNPNIMAYLLQLLGATLVGTLGAGAGAIGGGGASH